MDGGRAVAGQAVLIAAGWAPSHSWGSAGPGAGGASRSVFRNRAGALAWRGEQARDEVDQPPNPGDPDVAFDVPGLLVGSFTHPNQLWVRAHSDTTTSRLHGVYPDSMRRCAEALVKWEAALARGSGRHPCRLLIAPKAVGVDRRDGWEVIFPTCPAPPGKG